MNYYYAQIDPATRTCIAITQTSAAITAPNMVLAESLDSALMGQTHDAASNTWTAPAPTPAAPTPRHISVGAFFDRFGSAKWAILADATPAVQAVIKDASVRSYIDLDNPELPAGLALLIAAGHAIDAAAIVGNAVQPSEAP